MGKLGVPVVGRMAIGALAGEMAGRPGVATLAVGEAAMIKGGSRPAICSVTIGTLAGEVAFRCITGMAAGAVVKTTVVEGYCPPIFGAGMAVRTLTGEMIFRCTVGVAADAVG